MENTTREEWDRAFTAMVAAQAASDAYDAPYSELCGKLADALEAIPHATLRPDPHSGRLDPVTTADRYFVAKARKLVKDVDGGRCWLETERYPSLGDHLQLSRDLAAAADERDAQVQAIRDSLGMDEADERYERLVDEMVEAEHALLTMPAPDTAALLWKIERLCSGSGAAGQESLDPWSMTIVQPMVDDAHRLLSAGEA